jgi:hypothetical protein
LKDALLLGIMLDKYVSCLDCSSSGELAIEGSGFSGGLFIVVQDQQSPLPFISLVFKCWVF